MTVGFLGTGLMGAPMALRLLASGQSVAAYNRTADKLAPLKDAGATAAATPAEAIAAADATIAMLTDAAALQDLLLNDDSRAAIAGKTLVQMGTIGPRESQALAQAVGEAGGEYLEAPVLGSIPEAKSGQLLVMVGGDRAGFERWSDLLKTFGPDPLHVGPVGSAAALKLAMNQLIGSLTAAFAASFGLVRRSGVETDKFMQILRQSALYAPTFDKKLPRMAEGRFDNPNFPTKHLLKDLDLFAAEAEAAGLDAGTVRAASALARRAVEGGWADADYSALLAAIERPAG